MTLPSLCSAIRSQLYFSQISAWTEQLRTAPRSAVHNSRLLAVADGLHHRLDVHYRIRPFDNTASFTAKPTVHNFPDAIVSDTRCVRVSLKSLPRLDAIPSLAVAGPGRSSCLPDPAAVSAAGTIAAAGGAVAEASTSSSSAPSASSSASPLSIAVRMDDHRHQPHQSKQQCTETGKHQCSAARDSRSSSSDGSGPEESPSPSSSMPSPLENPLLAHRNRQLQKYRKRLLRREQKKKTPPTQSTSSTCGPGVDVNVNSIVTALVHSSESPATGANIVDDSAAAGQISINSIRPPLYSAMQLDSAGSASTTTTTTTTTAMSVVVTPSITASSATVRHLHQEQQQQCVEMKSIGTQTQQLQPEPSHAYPNCDLCGIEMQFVCWNCDKKVFDRWSSRPASPGQMSIAQACGSATGERLIQSIQRTPSFRQLQQVRQRMQQQAAMTVATHINYCDQQQPLKQQQINDTCDSRTAAGQSDGRADVNDCRLCKRQKTAHNYSNGSSNGNNDNTLACSSSFNSIIINNNNNSSVLLNNNNHHTTSSFLDNEESMPFASCSSSGGDTSSGLGSHNSSANSSVDGSFHRRTMSESLDSTLPELCAISVDVADQAADLTHQNAVSTSAASHLVLQSAVQMSEADLKLYRRAFSEDVLACGCHDDDDAFRPRNDGSAADDLKRTSKPIDITENSPTDVQVVAHAGHNIGTPLIVFKTPTTPGRSPMLPHPLTISTSQQPQHELPQALQMTCSPSSSLSAMSLGSATSPQLPQSQPQPQHLYPTASVYVDRPVPKVNLNKIFSISPSDVNDHGSAAPCFTFDTVFAAGGSRPTTIGLVRQRAADDDTDGGQAAAAAENDDLGGPIVIGVVGTVHKSNSAPSFAGAASSTFAGASASSAAQQLLSPRFLKMAAIQKRRSRHLSDRSSERSSIGSDELMSDEEFGGGLENTYMVMLTPNRMVRGVVRKPLPKSYPFGRRALLGEWNGTVLWR